MEENNVRSVDDLLKPLLEILTIDQTCEDCILGVHPEIPYGISGALNSMSWLILSIEDGPGVRHAIVAALPAFAFLVWMAISDTPSFYREWSKHHQQLSDIAEQLDPWLPIEPPLSISAMLS